jgi:hypothetical protein
MLHTFLKLKAEMLSGTLLINLLGLENRKKAAN